MHERPSHRTFRSALGPYIEAFIQAKQACGYKYLAESEVLSRLDRFLVAAGLMRAELPRELVERWISKRLQESTRTHRTRLGLLRRLALFLQQQGCPAYVPNAALARLEHSTFVPRILTSSEIAQLLAATDRLRPDPRSPLRHLILPELFRLLYSCGLRVSEALQLTVDHVDLHEGILTIRQSKFRKDRLVPLTVSMTARLRQYAARLGEREGTAVFFPAPDSGPYHRLTIYAAFRSLLWTAGIMHGGRGHGPRLHDLRHTFAVHRLLGWYQDGADLTAKLPVLATYLGHQSIADTQRYLQLTTALLPEITARSEGHFGQVIPRRTTL